MGLFSSISKLIRSEPVASDVNVAATRATTDTVTWRAPVLSADAAILPDKEVMDARGHDLLRNEAHVRGAGKLHQDSVVGSTFRVLPRPLVEALDDDIGFDEEFFDDFAEEAGAKFNRDAASIDCWLDVERRSMLVDILRVAVITHFTTGEYLGVFKWINDPHRPFKTALLSIDPARLSNPNWAADSDRIRGGIEFDRYGAPVAYHISSKHPGDLTGRMMTWERVPARAPNGRIIVLHVTDIQRVGQSRGVAAMVAGFRKIRMLSRFSDAALQKAIINSMIAMTIEAPGLHSDKVFERLGGGFPTAARDSGDGSVGARVAHEEAAYNAGIMRGVQESQKKGFFTRLAGSAITHLLPGWKLQTHKIGDGAQIGSEFEASMIRGIAASLGVSYEELSRDYQHVNYSTMRAGMLQTQRSMNVIKTLVADRIATAIYRAWLEEAIFARRIKCMPEIAASPAWLYSDGNLDSLASCRWISSTLGQVDELKESQAAEVRIRAGLSSIEIETAKLGQTAKDVMRSIARDRRMRDRFGIPQPEDLETKSAAALRRRPKNRASK